MTEDRVQKAIANIHKKYGTTAIMKLGDKAEMNIEVVSTGNIEIDLALGVGGLPRGRIVEVFGPESSGKSTLTLQTIAQAQKLGGRAAFVDVEHALDPVYAAALGVDVDNLYIAQPGYGEEALTIVDELVRSGGFAVIVVDSVAALTPKSELEGEMGDANVGKHARMMAQALRKITAEVNNSKTLLIFTNQIREKIGVMFGTPETTPGGRALPFYCSVRIDMRRKDQRKDSDGLAAGNLTKIKIIKNKVAPPFRECEVELEYGVGFVNETSLLQIGPDAGALIQSGTWYSTLDGEKMGQGKVQATQFLKENPDEAEKIREKILEWAAG